jgi:hypothetical protein
MDDNYINPDVPEGYPPAWNSVTSYGGNDHYKIVSLLTQWDTKQEKRDKHHNRYFLPIAFRSLDEAEKDLLPAATTKEIITNAFNGRLAAFILKGMGIPFEPEEIR